MSDPIFDHDRLDVYRLAIEYSADSFAFAKKLSGLHRHARDQWLRAAQSVPLNIAEGNGKRSPKDRARFFDIAVDYEHRFAEHEQEEEPEPAHAAECSIARYPNSQSFRRTR